MEEILSEPRRFSIRSPRGFILGVAVGFGIAIAGLGLGRLIYWPRDAASTTELASNAVAKRPMRGELSSQETREQVAATPDDHGRKIRNANSEDIDAGAPNPAVVHRVALTQPGLSVSLVVQGRTRCMLSRRGIIAAAILRPVTEVLVSPGDRVTKGQVLVKLYDLEPQAKVRAREKELRSIEAKAQYSRRTLEMADNTQGTGALPFITLNDIRATASSNDALVQAAEAELSLAQNELKLYSLTASLDGEISWLDVSQGTVTWPGSLIWGEIVDLRELDVRCELSLAQVEQVAVGQSAEVWLDDKESEAVTGSVVFVGKSAERTTGLIPAIIRVANADERLRAEVPVNVRFRTGRDK